MITNRNCESSTPLNTKSLVNASQYTYSHEPGLCIQMGISIACTINRSITCTIDLLIVHVIDRAIFNVIDGSIACTIDRPICI